MRNLWPANPTSTVVQVGNMHVCSSSTDTDITNGASINRPPTTAAATPRPSFSSRAVASAACFDFSARLYPRAAPWYHPRAPPEKSGCPLWSTTYPWKKYTDFERGWLHAKRNVYVIKKRDLNLITSAFTFDLLVQKEDYLMNTFFFLALAKLCMSTPRL